MRAEAGEQPSERLGDDARRSERKNIGKRECSRVAKTRLAGNPFTVDQRHLLTFRL